ncbi:PLDc N-terminal domain-containing protein [Nocardioides massiliensis]|uniref:Cardiolipin synthase N-terminal domain-containing protein n=1 Tax=Nocardioides massiliensis TaxID=1325935 RepID=A0ABT9NLD3_9ACTN|nr:PLDc N-terminal domain-containing protein [Nocardioides massiliensis]MDP9821228.1 hypothetical protein [Nocardioides massiliensis]
MAARRQWKDLSPVQRTAVSVVGVVQVALAVTAWRDLARRPASQVNGPKPVWAAVIGINVVGPIAYFRKGRRT